MSSAVETEEESDSGATVRPLSSGGGRTAGEKAKTATDATTLLGASGSAALRHSGHAFHDELRKLRVRGGGGWGGLGRLRKA
jgi:hypothetical protein